MGTGADGAMQGRDMRLDAAKGFGILLVYLGHAFLYGSYPSRWIFYFHMPLFFFLSGVFDGDRREAAGEIGRRLWARLVVPIVFYSVVGLVLRFLTYDSGRFTAPWPVWQDRLLSLYRGEPFFLGSLWFVVCLLGAKAVVLILERTVVRYIPERRRMWAWVCAIAGLFLLGKSVRNLDATLCPLKMLSVPMAAAYCLAGSRLARFIRSERMWPRWQLALVAFVGFAVLSAVAVHARKYPNLCIPVYPKTQLWLLGSVGGIVGVLALSRLWHPRWLAWIGRNSLHYFLLEAFAVYACICCLRVCGVRELSFNVFLNPDFPRIWIAVIVPASLALVTLALPVVKLAYRRFAALLGGSLR